MASHDLPLGRAVDYPRGYDPGLLFPIARAHGRAELGVGGALPFEGTDRWHAYELGWLNARGQPAVAPPTIPVPSHSPPQVDSTSPKHYPPSHTPRRPPPPTTMPHRM